MSRLITSHTYLGSIMPFSASDLNIWTAKAFSAIYSLSIIWKYDHYDKIDRGLL